MKLVHTVKLASVLPIIREGIKCGIDLPESQRQYVESNPNYIYLSAVNGISFPEIEATIFSYASGFDKHYHFFLDTEWVRAHAGQFKERAIYLQSSDEFYRFMEELGIEESRHGFGEDDVRGNQVISAEPIPIEGIEALLIKRDPTSPECDYWDLHGEDLSKIDPKHILSVGKFHDKYVRLRDIVPHSMALYVGDGKQTVRINNKFEKNL